MALPILLLAALAGVAAAQTNPPPPPNAPPAMVPIAKEDASAILGRPVLDAQGDVVGRITDVLVDAAGQVLAAVVDVGGFLGVGQRRIAVAWPALRFDPASRTIKLSMGAPELAAAPEYKPNAPGNVVATPTDASPPNPGEASGR